MNDNKLTNVLQNVTSPLSRLTQASEAQTVALTDLKEDLLLQEDTTDEEQNLDKQPDSGDITAVVNNCTLDPSQKNVASESRSDSEAQSQDNIVESLTQAYQPSSKNLQQSSEKLRSSSTLCLRVAFGPTRLKRALKLIVIQCGESPNTREILTTIMDSVALLCNTHHKLNMKRRELIKPELNPPSTRLCKEEIKPSTGLF